MIQDARLDSGLNLQYTEQGDPNGPAIVCLHGYSDSLHSYDRMLPFFSPANRVLAYSQRGHGDSDKPECCYKVDDFVDDLIGFMDSVGVREGTLVGHSGGTLIAARAALRHRRRVTRLVLIGSAIMGSRGQAVVEMCEAVHTLTDPVPAEFAREFQQSTIHEPIPAEFLELVVSESLKLPARVWQAYVDGVVLGPNHTSRLNALDVPTLILWGDRDAFFPRDEQERLARAIPGARLEVYPETGHALHWERPEETVRDVEAFMRIGSTVA